MDGSRRGCSTRRAPFSSQPPPRPPCEPRCEAKAESCHDGNSTEPKVKIRPVAPEPTMPRGRIVDHPAPAKPTDSDRGTRGTQPRRLDLPSWQYPLCRVPRGGRAIDQCCWPGTSFSWTASARSSSGALLNERASSWFRPSRRAGKPRRARQAAAPSPERPRTGRSSRRAHWLRNFLAGRRSDATFPVGRGAISRHENIIA